MGQRASIVLIALFVTCFVGSCAVGSLTAVNAIVAGVTSDEPSRPRTRSTPPPDEASTEPDSDEGDTSEPAPVVAPPVKPVTPEPAASAEYYPPEVGTAEFAIFHLANVKTTPWTTLLKLTKGTKLKVFRDSAPDGAEPPYLIVRDTNVEDYPPIEDNLAGGDGLTPAMIKGVPTAKQVTVIEAVLPLHDASLLDVSKIVLVTAQATSGVLWDADAQDFFSPEAWKKARVASWEKTVPYALMHFSVFTESRGNFVDLKTGGLTHFGLPELELLSVPQANQDFAVALLNVLAQQLVERTTTPSPGPMSVALSVLKHKAYAKEAASLTTDDALKEVDVTLVGKSDEKGPVLQVNFPGKGAPADRVVAGITALFGTQAPSEDAPLP
jgi:hypothetical protein